jgi:uncharacterized protein
VRALRKRPRKSGFPHAPNFGRNLAPFVVAAILPFIFGVFLLTGCGEKPLSKAETRAITTEIVAAAHRASDHSAEVTIAPEPAGGNRTVDHVRVMAMTDDQLRGFRAALSEIADRHNLKLAESGTALPRFVFSFHGEATHLVAVTVRPERVDPTVSARRGSGPRLAIIIDDMGEDRKEAESVLALRFPVTLSVLPNLPFSQETAEEAHRHKDEVMLHLPMESRGEAEEGGKAKPEPHELRVGMAAREVESGVAEMLSTVPYAAGVNNHQGSKATSNAALMRALMQSLRGKNLFFIDSRTTPDTVAYETAESLGIKAASRKVFLDDKLSRAAIAAQLELAASDAKLNGFAIAIGHPHPETIAVLSRNAPRLQKHGIVLVFPSELVR